MAVLSSLGAQLTLYHHNYWSPRTAPLDISAWKLDTEIEETLRKYLGGRFEFVHMDFDPTSMLALPTRLMRETKTIELLKKLPNPGVDAYILVRPAQTMDMFAANQGLSLDLVAGRNTLWANFEIDVIDAHTLRYISQSLGRTATRENEPLHFPAIEMPYGFWLGLDAPPMSQARQEVLHKYVQQMVTLSLVETIRSLQFGVALPPTGDHSIAEPILSDSMSRIRSVAVVSAIGDVMHLLNGGHALIDKTDEIVPTSNWGIDDQAEAAARDFLAPHYTVKSASIDRRALAGITLLSQLPIPHIAALLRTNDVDAYIVILKASAIDSRYAGLGLSHWKPFLADETNTVFADYAIAVIDARTLQPLGGIVAEPPLAKICEQPLMPSMGVPSCLIANKYWPQKPGELTEEAKSTIRSALQKILAGSIPETLFQLGLDETPQAEETATPPHP